MQSQNIVQACYECEWYEFDAPARRTLFIIMERAKRPLKLTAAKIAELSLETFTKVRHQHKEIRVHYSECFLGYEILVHLLFCLTELEFRMKRQQNNNSTGYLRMFCLYLRSTFGELANLHE